MSVADNLKIMGVELSIKELNRFRDAGGKSVIEVTNIGINRDVSSLQMISEGTGLNIIAGSGYYLESSHPPEVKKMSVDELAAAIVKDHTDGIDGTDIKAGIIGEIGLSEPIHPEEKMVLEASVKAQKQTGLPITIHQPLFINLGKEVLDILNGVGADLSKAVMGHIDLADPNSRINLDEAREIADSGIFIEFDLWGAHWYSSYADKCHPSDVQRIDAVVGLVDKGYLDQILLSHDISCKIQLTAFEGFGYAHILRDIVPRLKNANLSVKEINTILVDNPRRVFTG